VKLACALAAALLQAACAGETPRAVEVPPPFGAPEADLGPVELEFAEHEVEVLTALGRGDPSVAARFGLNPSLEGSIDDARGGSSNWLSARDRAHGLDEAEHALSEWAVPARVVRGATPQTHHLRLERELVARMVKSERFRYDHERQLPRGASELVRAAVMAYSAAPTSDPRRPHEWWIVRRLEEIRAALRTAPLPLLESQELDDALDPLEKLQLSGVNGTLAALRVELGDHTSKDAARPVDAAEIERLVAAHVGTIAPLAVTRSRLVRAEAALKDEVRTLSARASTEDVRRGEQDAERLLLDSAPCGHPESKMRRALPPPERAPACAAVGSVLATKDERSALAATIALHDHVAIALWAIAVRADGLDPDVAQAKTKLLSATPPDRSVRMLRLAVVRPAVAIGAGLGAELLLRNGPAGIGALARAWSEFGDAPLDVIEREVVAHVK
jgi:hypothetical protein